MTVTSTQEHTTQHFTSYDRNHTMMGSSESCAAFNELNTQQSIADFNKQVIKDNSAANILSNSKKKKKQRKQLSLVPQEKVRHSLGNTVSKYWDFKPFCRHPKEIINNS